MKTQLIIGALAIMVALSLCSSAELAKIVQSAQALSVFVHNANIPLHGAHVTYAVRDHSIQYTYVFHKNLNSNSYDIELPLPDVFKNGDNVSVTLYNPGAKYFQPSEIGRMGNGGIDVWFFVAPYNLHPRAKLLFL
jgi:hypothetical protein